MPLGKSKGKDTIHHLIKEFLANHAMWDLEEYHDYQTFIKESLKLKNSIKARKIHLNNTIEKILLRQQSMKNLLKKNGPKNPIEKEHLMKIERSISFLTSIQERLLKQGRSPRKINRSKFHSDSDVSTELTDDSQKLSVEESSSADSSARSISPASLSPSPYALLQKELEETEEAFQKLQQKYLLSESKNEELGRELYDKGRDLLRYQSANRANMVDFDARIKEMHEEMQ